MFKKLAVSLGVLAMVFGVFFVSEVYAERFGPTDWRTEDGQYELTIYTTSDRNDVELWIWDVYYVNYNNGYATYQDDLSVLSVRLCSVSTGNCTPFYNFTSGGNKWFTNMIPGTYRVDIRDSWANYYFKGKIEANTY